MPFEIDPRRIPVIGNDIYQVGQVYRTISQPCSPDPYLMVQATFTYAPTLIWSLIKPDPIDLAFDRAGRNHRRVRRRRVNVDRLFQLPVPERGSVGWFMFRGASLGQAVGNYLLIADATTDFLVNWTSLVWEWSGCTEPSTGYARAFGAFGTVGISIGTTRAGIVYADFESTGTGFAAPGLVRIADAGPKNFGFTLDLSIDDIGLGTPSIDLVEVERTVDGNAPELIPISPVRMPDGEEVYTAPDLLFFGSTPQTEWRVFVTWTNGRLQHNGGMMQVTAAPEQGLEPDP